MESLSLTRLKLYLEGVVLPTLHLETRSVGTRIKTFDLLLSVCYPFVSTIKMNAPELEVVLKLSAGKRKDVFAKKMPIVIVVGLAVIVLLFSSTFLLFPHVSRTQATSSLPQSNRDISPKANANWTLYQNPAQDQIKEFCVVSPKDVFGFTMSGIVHFDGIRWASVYSTRSATIGPGTSDGEFCVFSIDSTIRTMGINIPTVCIGRIVREKKGVRLENIRTFQVPVGHDLSGLRFVRHDVVLGTTILEGVFIRIIQSHVRKVLGIQYTAFPLPLHDSGGFQFASGSSSGFRAIWASYNLVRVKVEGMKLDAKRILNLSDEKPLYLAGSSRESIRDATMSDTSSFVVLTDSRLILVKHAGSSDNKIGFAAALTTGVSAQIPAADIVSILVLDDSRVFALTKTNVLLERRLSGTGDIGSGWVVRTVLPLFGQGVMAKLDSNRILIGSNAFIIYDTRKESDAGRARKSTQDNSIGFTLTPLEVGSTYGVGIGHFDKSSHYYVYSVDLSGPNRLFIIPQSSISANDFSNSVSVAAVRGVLGRMVGARADLLNNDLSIAVGDVNEDGWDDIAISYLEGNPVLYINNGSGYFRDEAVERGLGDNLNRSECVTLADVNNDGYLDLFATSFLGSNKLYLNEGGGRFKDVTKQSGLETNGQVITGVFGDLNGDGFPDLYVGCWNAENRLYLNNGDGTFRDVTKESGTGCGLLHETNSILLADFNNDGSLEIFVGNREGGNRLFLNDGEGHFRDVTKEAGLADTMFAYGSVFGDFTDDGRLDIIVAGLKTVRFYQNLRIRKDGVPIFKDETSQFIPSSDYLKGYNTGAATFDQGNNGDLDAIIGQFGGTSVFLRSSANAISGAHKNFVEVNVEGIQSDRDGIGAKVRLLKNGKMIAYREVVSTYGYASSSSRTQLFGIADPNARYQVEVNFPASGVERIVDVQPGSIVNIREFTGLKASYYLFVKFLERQLVSPRLREIFVLFMFIAAVTIVSMYLKIPFLLRDNTELAGADKVRILAVSLSSFIVIVIAVRFLESLFYGPSHYVNGSTNVFTQTILPAVSALGVAAILMKSVDNRRFRDTLTHQLYARLNIMLRKFSHGEGALSNLNSVSLFSENIESVLEQRTGRPLTAFDPSSPTHRFNLAIQEYKQKTEPELEEIASLLELTEQDMRTRKSRHSFRSASGSLRTDCSILTKELSRIQVALRSTTFDVKKLTESGREVEAGINRIEETIRTATRKFESEYVTDVGRVVSSEIESFSSRTSDFKIVYESNVQGSKGVIAPVDLQEVLAVLIQNSIDSLSGTSKSQRKIIRVRMYSENSRIKLEVEDNGTGVSDAIVDQIFEYGFSTKAGKRGIGLPDAQECLWKYGGELSLDTSFTEGARFVAEIPKALESDP